MIEYLSEFFAVVSLIAIPIYIANGLALVFGGGPKIDLGKNFVDGKRLLGDGKSFMGAATGIFFGSVGIAAVQIFLPQLTAFLPVNYLQYGFLLATGAILGDVASSFVKRRMGKERGKSVVFLDQLDFLVGGIVLGMIVFVPSVEQFVFLAVFTFSVHRFANLVAFKIKMKKVPW